MPLTIFVTDALGVVTICLVAILVLLGLFCVAYTFYFRSQIHSHDLGQLKYFSGPWVIRIVYIFFSIWWGVGEILRLNVFRRDGGILDAFSSPWQENICKCYIISNLGFAEPCLFLTIVFLLRASLQRCGTLNHNWNLKTASLVLLFCFPVFILQVAVISIGPFYKDKHMPELPSYFIKAAVDAEVSGAALCTYPLLSTIFLGLYATVLTAYLFWLGARILRLVINKGLQKRVHLLIFSISSIFLLRLVLLGLSVLSKPEQVIFNVIVFLAFISFLCCAVVGIFILVYLPIADSLALRSQRMDIEALSGYGPDNSSLLANQSPTPNETMSSPDVSSGRGSISFRAVTEGKERAFIELGLFNPSDESTPPGSPRGFGWRMMPSNQGQ